MPIASPRRMVKHNRASENMNTSVAFHRDGAMTVERCFFCDRLTNVEDWEGA